MLPNQLKYGSKIESASARSYKTNVQPQNGTNYSIGNGSSNIIYFNIPTGNNLLMCPTENYMRFDVQYNNASGANSSFRWDACGAHGIIQRIRVFHGSNMIEDIDTYGNLAKMLISSQISCPSNKTKWNILAGTRNDYVTYMTGAAWTANGSLSTTNVQSGEFLSANSLYTYANNTYIPNNTQIAAGGNSATRTYCLNLISIVGSLCQSKYFPLFACGGSPLRVEIWLQDNLEKMACVTSNNGTLSLSNVEFVCDMIELNDTGMQIIQQSLEGNPLQFVVPSYRNYQYTTPALTVNQTTINMPIPAKFSSLKSLLISIRDTGTGNAQYFPFSSVCLGTTGFNYYFRIGSLLLPPKYPYSITEAFAELAKAISSIADINYLANVDYQWYSLTDSKMVIDIPLNGGASGCFYIGLDCENYPNASKSEIFAGMNTNASDIYLVYNITPVAAQNGNDVRMDAYALFDQLLIFENNTCYVKF